jgi:deoxyribodipyrimidine photo-lyase
LSVFEDALRGYREQRDLPDRRDLAAVAAPAFRRDRAVAHRPCAGGLRSAGTDADIDGYLRQLGWRDFAYHLLHHFPKTPTDNLNPRFDRHAQRSAAA